MGWTEEQVERLKRAWAMGRSITQIGKDLGMTRNAVVGKAHRLGLSRRPSPIVRSAPVVLDQRGPPCKWPIGDPKAPDFGFCGRPSVVGRPYCASHCVMAYATWGDQRSSAA